MSEQLSDRAGLPNLVERMKQLIRKAAQSRILTGRQKAKRREQIRELTHERT